MPACLAPIERETQRVFSRGFQAEHLCCFVGWSDFRFYPEYERTSPANLDLKVGSGNRHFFHDCLIFATIGDHVVITEFLKLFLTLKQMQESRRLGQTRQECYQYIFYSLPYISTSVSHLSLHLIAVKHTFRSIQSRHHGRSPGPRLARQEYPLLHLQGILRPVSRRRKGNPHPSEFT
jgi:hypothetical protein